MKLIQYFEPYRNEFGLLERLDKWVFVEWSKANDYVQDVNYPTNMLYARMLEAAGRLYHRPSLLSNAEMIRKVIREQSYKNGFFCDHAIRKNGVLEVQQQHQDRKSTRLNSSHT